MGAKKLLLGKKGGKGVLPPFLVPSCMMWWLLFRSSDTQPKQPVLLLLNMFPKTSFLICYFLNWSFHSYVTFQFCFFHCVLILKISLAHSCAGLLKTTVSYIHIIKVPKTSLTHLLPKVLTESHNTNSIIDSVCQQHALSSTHPAKPSDSFLPTSRFSDLADLHAVWAEA